MSSSFIRLLLEIINGSTKLIESSGVAYYFLVMFSSVEAVFIHFCCQKCSRGRCCHGAELVSTSRWTGFWKRAIFTTR